MAPLVPIGPFDLTEPLARGGMGEVWLGAHRTSGVPVAVKVLSADGLANKQLLDALRNEVRAVAGLDHPHIVWVYDQGIIDERAERRSLKRLVAGTPWLAMELARGGTLSKHLGSLEWMTLREVLMQLLDALAHAHARGVLHRDIKPANVLFGGARPGLKLTDFGMVYAVEQHARPLKGNSAMSGGTPAYMAPEQILEQLEDQGPWTDLYALGCLGWTMTCRRRPYPGRDATKVLNGHLDKEIPRLAPAFVIPDGFEDWIRRLMAKNPEDRFRRAADAAWALGQLDDVEPTAATNAAQPILASTQLTTLILPLGTSRTPPKRAVESLPEIEQPPVPETWRRLERTRPAVELVGAGIGLYGLRTLPVVDRDEERDRLWKSLRDVAATGKPHAVVLRGPAGCGKSRLGEWLCVRAHEVGAATTLRALHNPIASPHDGFAGMLGRALRCFAHEREEMAPHIREVLARSDIYDPQEMLALVELLRPAPDAESAVFRFESTAERHELIWRTLERLATERPLVLWLDDVQWGPDALRFTRRVMDRRDRRAAPVLFVLTAREEALDSRVSEAQMLDELAALDGVSAVPIGPIPASHRLELVRELLGLEPDLAARVEARTNGNPLFAVQLVGDWVERGLLEVGPKGFQLRKGAAAALPDSIHDVWVQRIDQLVRGEPGWRKALEIAAILGQEIAVREWRDACKHGGVKAPMSLVRALEDQRLARIDHERGGYGWSFVHGMLRESLERGARAAGRWAEHHDACALMMATRSGPGTAARHGWHLLCAGRVDEALHPLQEGSKELILIGDFGAADRILDAREQAMTDAGIPETDAAWGRGWLDRHSLIREQGRLEEASRWVRKALLGARENDWPIVEVIALTYEAELLAQKFEMNDAVAVATEARLLAEERGQERNHACALHTLGLVARYQGHHAQARDLLTHAVEFYEQIGEHHRVCIAWQALANVALDSGDLDEVERWVQRYRERAELHGFRALVANADVQSGEVYRYRGELDVAERCYRSALRVHEALDHQGQVLDRVNLGYVLIERGQIAAARPFMERALRDAMKAFHHYCAAIGMLCIEADGDDEFAWTRHLGDVRRLGQGRVDGDFARMSQIAGQRAADAGFPGRAKSAWNVALDQWERLGRDTEAAELRGAIERL